uniref:SLPTX10 n=1 Tax=Scolopendra viridis TaxID=118503 RepID=A0A4D5R9T6_SCOVI
MIRAIVISFFVLFLMYIFEISLSKTVDELEEPQSFKDVLKKAKNNKTMTNLMRFNRVECMPNCNIIRSHKCDILSPECCPKRSKVCEELDIVKERDEKRRKALLDKYKKKWGIP